MSLPEIFEVISSRSEELCQQLEIFGKAIDDKMAQKNINDDTVVSLRKSFGQLKAETMAIPQKSQKRCREELEMYRKLETEIQKNKKVEKDLFQLKENKKPILDAIKTKIENVEKKDKNLQNSRDLIKAFKLLTNTNFVYQGNNTAGFILQKGTSVPYEVFDYSPETQQTNISRELWKLLETTSLKN